VNPQSWECEKNIKFSSYCEQGGQCHEKTHHQSSFLSGQGFQVHFKGPFLKMPRGCLCPIKFCVFHHLKCQKHLIYLTTQRRAKNDSSFSSYLQSPRGGLWYLRGERGTQQSLRRIFFWKKHFQNHFKVTFSFQVALWINLRSADLGRGGGVF